MPPLLRRRTAALAAEALIVTYPLVLMDLVKDQLTATVRSHQNVAEAVLMHDGETARQASRAHLVEYKQWLERHQPDLLHKRVEWVGTP